MAKAPPRKKEHKSAHKTKQRKIVMIKILFYEYFLHMGTLFKYSRGFYKIITHGAVSSPWNEQGSVCFLTLGP